MTTGKLKALFDFYGKFLRRQYPDALSKQIDDSMSARRRWNIDPLGVQGHLVFMTEEARRFVEQGRTEKAMRWLGFLQGVLWGRGFFTLDDLKEHSRPREDTDLVLLSKQVTVDPGHSTFLVVKNDVLDPCLEIVKIGVENPEHFEVDQLLVGGLVQGMGSGSMFLPADLLSGSPELKLSFDLVPLNSSVCVTVINTSERPKDTWLRVVGRRAEKNVRRERILPFGAKSVLVQPNTEVVVSCQPLQLVMFVVGLWLKPETARDFELNSISLRGAVIWNNPTSQRGFQEIFFRTGAVLENQALRPDDWAEIRAMNRADGPRRFQGCLFGRVCE